MQSSARVSYTQGVPAPFGSSMASHRLNKEWLVKKYLPGLTLGDLMRLGTFASIAR